jgi:hypothetical protein
LCGTSALSWTAADEELGEYLLRIHRKEMGPPICDLVSMHCLRPVGKPSQFSQCVLTYTPYRGVVLQIAAVNSAMFTIGRIFTFGMTGLAIVVVPIYNAEICPQVLRGMFS